MLLTENMASKISLENGEESGEQETLQKTTLHWGHMTTEWYTLPPFIVVQVGKQNILLHGFSQGRHAFVVFWDDLSLRQDREINTDKSDTSKNGIMCWLCTLSNIT